MLSEADVPLSATLTLLWAYDKTPAAAIAVAKVSALTAYVFVCL